MSKTVLIVEDERAIVEILKFNLQKEGYETLEALDGDTGLELARTAGSGSHFAGRDAAQAQRL